MTVALLDPLTMSAKDWPTGSEPLRAFVEEICRHGSQNLVANVRTKMMVLRHADVALPVSINDAEYDNSYVCSTYTISQYMKDELKMLKSPAVERMAAWILDATGAIMMRARLNKVVQVNNWLFETNPYPVDWRPNISALTQALTAAFPEHVICFGSLNEWANRVLMQDLVEAGYKLAAFRQIYVYDRLEETYLSHEDVERDHKILRKTPYRVVQNHEFGEEHYQRMAELYDMVYCQKHSHHNPAYTPDCIRVCHRGGVMRFLGLRSTDGRLDGVLGLLSIPGTTPVCPILGYDTTLDRRLGLFRMIIALIFKAALAEGWNVNLGGANAKFKRSRGGQPIIEYKANYSRHLSPARRATLGTLSGAANYVLVPLVRWLEI